MRQEKSLNWPLCIDNVDLGYKVRVRVIIIMMAVRCVVCRSKKQPGSTEWGEKICTFIILAIEEKCVDLTAPLCIVINRVYFSPFCCTFLGKIYTVQTHTRF